MSRALLGAPDQRGQLELQEFEVLLDLQEPPVLMGRQVLQELQAYLDVPATLAPLEQQEQLE